MRVLIVEDEDKLQTHLVNFFTEAGFSVFTCSTMGEFRNILTIPNPQFDAIVLDRFLHGEDSAPMIPIIKMEYFMTKIVVLSAINTPSEKATILDLGADDYLAKPFSAEELTARVRAVLRRNNAEISVGDLTLDVDNRALLISGQEIPLTNKEYLLIRAMIKAPGKIFNKSHFYETVWGVSANVDSNVVEVTINKLRKRLEEYGSSVQIKNSRNVGYWIEK